MTGTQAKQPVRPFFPLDEQVIENWLSSLDVGNSTKRAYKLGMKVFCEYVYENELDFDQLEEKDILDYKNDLFSRDLSIATCNQYLAAVRSFYRHAAANSLNNIAANIHGESTGKDFKKDTLSAAQVKKLLHVMPKETETNLRDFALVNLMVRTGLRDIEISRALVEDIRTINGQDVLFVQGKGHKSKDAFVVLSPSTLNPIKEYLKTRKVKGSSPLFTSTSNNSKGKALTTRSISKIVKNSMKGIGIDSERFTAHSLRHTAITLALVAGASPQQVRDMARHASIDTTLIYSHNLDRISDAAEYSVDSILS